MEMCLYAAEWLNLDAVLRGGQGGTPPCESCPLCSPYNIGCKIARLHNSCIHSVESRSWCQITCTTQSITHYVIRNSWVTGRVALWTYSTFPIVTQYILVFIIFKLRLTTFITANDGDDPAYSVKIQAPGAKRLGAKRP